MQKKRLTILEMLKALGPGAWITAALIGPGTVTTSIVAGARFEYALLWGVTFSVLASIIYQSMTARVALVGGKDLIESISEVTASKALQNFLKGFFLAVVLVACFAFQAGNMIGAAIGMKALTGVSQEVSAIIQAVVLLLIILLGSYKRIEKLMVFFVLLMSISFLVSAFAAGPNLLDVIKGAVVPSIPEGSFLTVIGLIGTTIIPMNLLLHSILVRERWKSAENLPEANADLKISICIAGIMTAGIIVTSGTLLFGRDVNAAVLQFHQMLEPLLGEFAARMVGGTGLMIAGFSSAIAVPLTAGYVMSRVFKWENHFASNAFRITTLIIVLFGAAFTYLNQRPVQIILAAQVINGLFLPFVTIFIMYIMNSKKLLGDAVNNLTENILGGAATLLAIFLGVRGFYAAITAIMSRF
jgi:NRAMP (natural resistance-associated macrophage protein)-like metal ion transporter